MRTLWRKALRRAWGTCLIGAALAVSTACGQAAPSGGAGEQSPHVTPTPSTPTRTTTRGGVTLTATMSVGFAQHPADPAVRRKPGIVVDYTLRNDGTRHLVAYDMVPDALGSATLPPDLDPEHAWVYPDSGLVRISKQGFATASGVSFIAAPMIGARTLDPGATLTGRAYAVSPPTLTVPGPDFDAPRVPVDPAATQAQFCVQVGERTPQMRPSSSVEGVLEAPVAAPGPGELLCTAPVPLVTP